MKYLFLLLIGLSVACTNNAVQLELDLTKKQLEEAQQALSELETATATEGKLVHIVLFKLKSEADQAKMIAEIKKLEAITEIEELEVGPFQDLGDARALSDYAIIMEMSFQDATAYQKYQEHPIHQALKENTLSLLGGPPATYDYIKK